MNDLTPLRILVERVERSCTVYHGPNFTMAPSWLEARRRRNKVCAFAIGFGLPIAVGFFGALIFLPL